MRILKRQTREKPRGKNYAARLLEDLEADTGKNRKQLNNGRRKKKEPDIEAHACDIGKAPAPELRGKNRNGNGDNTNDRSNSLDQEKGGRVKKLLHLQRICESLRGSPEHLRKKALGHERQYEPRRKKPEGQGRNHVFNKLVLGFLGLGHLLFRLHSVRIIHDDEPNFKCKLKK